MSSFATAARFDAISGDDLTGIVITLKKDHGLGSNTILHNAVIITQLLKRHGRIRKYLFSFYSSLRAIVHSTIESA